MLIFHSDLESIAADEASERFTKFLKKYNKRKLSEEFYVKASEPEAPQKPYYPPAPTTGDVSILLFYAYCPIPMTRGTNLSTTTQSIFF